MCARIRRECNNHECAICNFPSHFLGLPHTFVAPPPHPQQALQNKSFHHIQRIVTTREGDLHPHDISNLFHALAKTPDIDSVPYSLVDRLARMLLPHLPQLEPWQFAMALYACGKLRYRNELFLHAVIEHALSEKL